MMYKIKKKYAYGGSQGDYQDEVDKYAAIGNFASDALTSIAPNSTVANIGGGALKGAATGLEAGAAFGPEGAVIGGAVGGAVGLVGGIFSNKSKNDAKNLAMRQQNEARKKVQDNYERQVFSQYNVNGNDTGQGYYARGGVLPYRRNNKMAVGGYLNYPPLVQPPNDGTNPLSPQSQPTYDPTILGTNGLFMVQKRHVSIDGSHYYDTGQWGNDPNAASPVVLPQLPLSDKAMGNDNTYNARRDQNVNKSPDTIKPSWRYSNGGNISSKYAQGGTIPLASDTQKFVGPSHAQGGIPIDPNGDGVPEAEVEGDEVQKGNQIYSDRLNPSPQLQGLLKQNKINTDGTYADVATKLGKMKGKYETKLLTYSPLALRTGKAMNDRIDGLMQATFQDQEMTKPQETNPVMANGGMIKYADGGDNRTLEQIAYEQYLLNKTISTKAGRSVPSDYDYNKGAYVPLVAPPLPSGMEEYQDRTGDYKLRPTHSITGVAPQPGSYMLPSTQGYDPNSGIPSFLTGQTPETSHGASGSWEPTPIAPVTTPSATPPVVATRRGVTSYTRRSGSGLSRLPQIPDAMSTTAIQAPVYSNQIPFTSDNSVASTNTSNTPTPTGDGTSVGGLIDKYGADVLNVASYFGNQAAINKMKAPTYSTVAAPRYNYSDRSGLAKYENAVAAKGAMKGVGNTSSQGKSAEKADIYSRQIAGNNQINQQENLRKDSYDANYDNRVQQNNAINADILSRQSDVTTQVANEKQSLGIQNRNTLNQGIIANKATREQEDLDRQKALTILASTPDPDKALNLLNKFMSPEMAKRLQQLYKRR